MSAHTVERPAVFLPRRAASRTITGKIALGSPISASRLTAVAWNSHSSVA